jgi:hypothetical protein
VPSPGLADAEYLRRWVRTGGCGRDSSEIGETQPLIMLDQTAAGQTVDVSVGQAIELRLPENPSTGFRSRRIPVRPAPLWAILIPPGRTGRVPAANTRGHCEPRGRGFANCAWCIADPSRTCHRRSRSLSLWRCRRSSAEPHAERYRARGWWGGTGRARKPIFNAGQPESWPVKLRGLRVHGLSHVRTRSLGYQLARGGWSRSRSPGAGR